jgi:hypothetical protein
VDDVSKWPTGAPAPGQSYLALVGYKDYATKADAIAANGGAGAAPDLFVMIPKPATAGVNIMAFRDRTHIKFGNPSVDQVYQCILIDKFTFTSYSDPAAAPLAQYENAFTGSKSATFNATNPILVWQANVTLPALP